MLYSSTTGVNQMVNIQLRLIWIEPLNAVVIMFQTWNDQKLGRIAEDLYRRREDTPAVSVQSCSIR